MRVGIATDHGGFGLKEELVAQLRAAGHEVVDFGAHALSPGDDYPDFVLPLAQAVVVGCILWGLPGKPCTRSSETWACTPRTLLKPTKTTRRRTALGRPF
jgi:hypothetical protein